MERCDGFYDRRLFLIPFVLNILKMTFPYANQLLGFYVVGIRKLKPAKFKVERICQENFDRLLQDNKFKKDFFGDKTSWALISINSLAALSAFSSSWLQLLKIDDDTDSELKRPKYQNLKEKIKKIKVSKPDETDRDVIRDDGSGIDDFVVQCVATSSNVKDFHLFVTDSVFYNMKQKLNIATPCDSVEVMVNAISEEYRPEPATTAVVSPINSSFDISLFADLQDILQEYFSKPKYLRKNDCFSVILKKYAPHLFYTSTYSHVSKIHFKVINLVGKDNCCQSKLTNVGYYVAKNFTNLYTESSVPGYLIPEVAKYVRLSDKSGYEISICPSGLKEQFDRVKACISPFLYYEDLQARPIFLLSGAEGSGKKTVISCVAKFFGLHVLEVDCFDFYGAGSSATEVKLEKIASKTKKIAPCLLFLSNVQLIGRDRDHNEDVRLVEAFQHHLNQLFNESTEYPIIVVGTTDSKPSELVASVARAFLQTVSFDVPKSKQAYEILNWFVAESGRICYQEDLKRVSEKTTGYVFADLALLVRHALRFQREDETLSGNEKNIILQRHFEQSIEIMESAYSDSIGAAKVPTVRWEDVGGLENLKEEIMVTLNLPLKHPELFASGLKRSGILFYGPPGTGKTLMAKAVATECNFNFLSVKGPELMNMYVGQSEKNVREVFGRARDASPCIVFFDELDSLAPNRGKSGDSGGVTDRVVSQLLAEMDGLQENNRIFVIAATNRPDLVDPALLRPGRFDKMFYVGVCGDELSKLSIFKALTRKFKLSEDVRFEELVRKIPGQVTGADIYSVCSNAWLAAATRNIEKIKKGFDVSIPVQVDLGDFEVAASKFVPSLTAEDISYYQQLKSLER